MAGGREVRAGKAFVEITLRDKLQAGLKRASAQMRAFGTMANTIGSRLAAMGTAAAVPFALATRVFTGFADKMSEVRAITGASAGEFEQLSATAKQLGATTSFSASQVADAMKFLGMAGYNTEQILAGVPAVLNLARAGAVDLGMAADIASDVGSAFGLAADEIGRIADVMAKTATSANTNIEMMGETLKYAAPLANAAGQSLEDTAAAIGVLGNNGIKASMAGTDLAMVFKKVGSESRAAMEKVGVQTVDAGGKVRSVIDIMQDLGRATASMTDAQRLKFFASTFGRAAKSAFILANAGDSLTDLQSKLLEAGGSASKMAAQMDDNLGGSFRRLYSAAEGLAIAVGEALSPTISKIADRITGMVGSISRFVGENQQLIVTVAAATAGLTAAGVALLGIGAIATAVSAGISGLATVLGAVFSPIGLIIAGVVAVLAPAAVAIWKLAGAGQALAPVFGTAMQILKRITSALASGDLRQAGRLAITGLKAMWLEGMNALLTMWRNTWNSLLQSLSGDTTSATSLVGRAMSAIKDLIKSLWPTFQSIMKTLWSFFKDIWSQFPGIAGFVMGRVTRIVVSAALKLQQWLNGVMVNMAANLLGALRGLGPKLLTAMMTGDVSGVAKRIVSAMNAAFQRSAKAAEGLLAGIGGGEAPELTISSQTQAAYREMMRQLAIERSALTGGPAERPATPAAPDRPATTGGGNTASTPTGMPVDQAEEIAEAETKLEQYRQKLQQLVTDFQKGTISHDQFTRGIKNLRQEVLQIDANPLERFAERLSLMNRALADGVISAAEWQKQFRQAQQEILGVDESPLQAYAERVNELQAALRSGAISMRQYSDEVNDAKEEILGIDGSPLAAYSERVNQLQAALRSGAISIRQYTDEMRDAKEEILGIDGSPLEAYQERVRSLQQALRSGAISQQEFAREMQSAKQDMLGIDPTPVQQYMQRVAELRQMLNSGAINEEQFRAEAMEALPDKVKSIIDRTKSPLQKYQEQLAELRQFHDLGLIDKKQFAVAVQELGKEVLQMPSMDDVTSGFRSMGTLSEAAVFGLSAGGVNDRETKAAEATAQNTQKLVDHARRGRLVFG